MPKDLVERIETTRFLGSEFLLWLWFKSEIFEGEFALEGAGTTGRVELWLDTVLAFRSPTDRAEQTILKGLAPSGTPEAKQALQNTKVPVRARICITVEKREFAVILDASTLARSSVQIPDLLAEEEDDRFYERMSLLEQLDGILMALYAEFLLLRLSSLWDAEFLAHLKSWALAEEEGTLTGRAYAGLLKRAAKE